MSTARKIAVALGLAGIVVGASIPASITRTALRNLERSTDTAFEEMLKEDRLYILGATRGVYLQGYGVVFTTEVELVASAAQNPFRPAYSKEEIAKLKEKKRVRISYLKENMPAMLVNFASTLKDVPPGENVALAVTIPYFRWEDAEGMPRQILMSAPRKALVAAQKQSLTKAIRTEEFY
jgi:hypothetical protein